MPVGSVARHRPPRRATALIGLILCTAACTSTSPAPAASPEPIDLSAPGFWTGVTHDQYSADSWFDAGSVAAARTVLTDDVQIQNQSLMGWGANSPEPSPGVYDWSSLDARMGLISQTNGTTVLTLCGAPDWMKGGTAGTTDWSLLEVAPTPEHYQDFADLAVAALERYPQVRYVQVWNEMKGFFDASTNTWDVAAYTALYNTVYDAIKAADPTVQVGGPYVVMDSWSSAAVASHPSAISGAWGVLDQRPLDVLTSWLQDAHGADFVVVDGWTGTKDEGVTTDPVTAAQKFAAVDTWLAEQTTLPIWWAELHVSGSDGAATTPEALDAALRAVFTTGARVALLWDPQHDDGETEPWLWTQVSAPGGGLRGPYDSVWKDWSTRSGSPSASP
ncbi:MAG: hypothetical protein L6367_10170 [Cellulomonas sp.]|nr:hypothetical protein [Cellulomonas sp.]